MAVLNVVWRRLLVKVAEKVGEEVKKKKGEEAKGEEVDKLEGEEDTEVRTFVLYPSIGPLRCRSQLFALPFLPSRSS